ncbi:hypothetical protein CB0940_02811 [Cercospora beticola]|uniref:Stress-response A/B barrel domain-containing protein n=1 Tax=Cercospora beticola TaxID=122368 RepID=A0A2G5I2H6_CERBT|nr:hypothetical protein CB0940_02811 [Cercospora beticola]PIA99014.1 hypothetical protein CB0940_02811 [Cercospora beticola]WPA99960.1 hypothetical protein RHO25_004580 [Cercospora beticola]CAK1361861.1 unnamed protein product [Cercospora beticola]
MGVYHIVLFKLKPGVTQEQIAELEAAGRAMVGQVPGLVKFDFGPPLASTAHRALGYDLGLVSTLEKPEDVAIYAQHPAHLAVHHVREKICDHTLAYDLEF